MLGYNQPRALTCKRGGIAFTPSLRFYASSISNRDPVYFVRIAGIYHISFFKRGCFDNVLVVCVANWHEQAILGQLQCYGDA